MDSFVCTEVDNSDCCTVFPVYNSNFYALLISQFNKSQIRSGFKCAITKLVSSIFVTMLLGDRTLDHKVKHHDAGHFRGLR